MAKRLEYRQAILLRQEGKSYNQIRNVIPVAKSTLSVWLRNYPLSNAQLRKLQALSEIRIERYRQSMQLKREQRLSGYFLQEKEKWLPMSKREFYLAGLMLYWGEGNKSLKGSISINNTDPSVVKFALNWMIGGLEIPKEKIKGFIHLYSDMDINTEVMWWSEQLKLPLEQFTKPYVKINTRAEIDQKGFGHGTCGVRANDTVKKERLMMLLKAVPDYYFV